MVTIQSEKQKLTLQEPSFTVILSLLYLLHKNDPYPDFYHIGEFVPIFEIYILGIM